MKSFRPHTPHSSSSSSEGSRVRLSCDWTDLPARPQRRRVGRSPVVTACRVMVLVVVVELSCSGVSPPGPLVLPNVSWIREGWGDERREQVDLMFVEP